MSDRQNIELCQDSGGHVLGKGDKVGIPNEGTGTIYDVINVTAKSCIVSKNGETVSYLAKDCLKIV